MSFFSPTSIAERVILAEGWRASLLAVSAGAISALALAPLHWFPVLFFTFPVFVWLLDGAVAPAGVRGFFSFWRRFWPAFRVGWLFGFGYFLAGLWWVGQAFLVDAEEFIWLLPVAVLALPMGLALFWGLGAALARLAWGEGWVRLLAFACAMTLVEWLRGTVLTGFPWNTIGYGLMPTAALMQSAGLIGLYGVTFFTVFIVSTLAVHTPGAPIVGTLRPGDRKRGRVPLLIAVSVSLFVGHVVYGVQTLSQADNASQDNIRLRIVQPAINQSEKWLPQNEAEIMGRYIELSNSNTGPQTASVADFTHLIWPESAFPFVLTARRDQLSAIGRLLPAKTNLITGAMRLEGSVSGASSQRVFNVLYVINGEGEIIAARDKVHLVPFGEFLPFQDLLESWGFQQLTQQRGGFTPGVRRQTVSVGETPPFLPLICYEIIYSGALAGEGQEPSWIVNLTNDAWFGMTSGPYQHAHQARVRAVEEGLPVVRAANSGISMVVDAYGRVTASLALGQRGVVDANLPVPASKKRAFARFGNVPILVFICLVFLILIGVRSRNTQKL